MILIGHTFDSLVLVAVYDHCVCINGPSKTSFAGASLVWWNSTMVPSSVLKGLFSGLSLVMTSLDLHLIQ